MSSPEPISNKLTVPWYQEEDPTKREENMRAIERNIANMVNFLCPVGSIMSYAGSTAPDFWLFCAGQAVNRKSYEALFKTIGTTHGVGDGATTFNIPDLRGRGALYLDNMGGSDAGRLSVGNTLGDGGGAEGHVHALSDIGYAKILTDAGDDEIVHREVSTAAWNATNDFSNSSGGTNPTVVGSDTSSNTEGTGLGGTTDSGTGLSPYLLLNAIIKF